MYTPGEIQGHLHTQNPQAPPQEPYQGGLHGETQHHQIPPRLAVEPALLRAHHPGPPLLLQEEKREERRVHLPTGVPGRARGRPHHRDSDRGALLQAQGIIARRGTGMVRMPLGIHTETSKRSPQSPVAVPVI